ncbi:CopD family protein [Lysobacter yangpyeongensis]|uniref:Protoporphyrinogen IX oxidase n=1 Tax=Lysobacter yangpyeongensis TaxID=346182 RepID=A0ABW0SNW4_9GAMM
MQAYFVTKTAHLVFVMAWMGGVFYLPRILVNLAEAGDDAAVRARLVLMGKRLYRFGHIMFGLAFLLGLTLWLGHHASTALPDVVGGRPGWLHAKLGLVAVMLAHYIVGGRWLKSVEAGRALPSSRTLRWFNELPVFLLIAIVYLVLAKPF